MNKIKYVIGILLLFMVIGFATVTVTLSINGNAKILSDLDQFKVYFSDVKLNGSQDLSLVKSETELQFYFSFTAIGTTQVISYDVTNASKIFDASLNISCTQGDEYFSVVNVFDTTTNLEALGTRTGTLTMKKIKSVSSDSDKDYSVTCTIDATPIERDSEAGGSVISPVQPIQLYTGDVISIYGENFNVISQTDTTVTMLAQYNLGTDYRQSTTSNNVDFSDDVDWFYSGDSPEIDIQLYSDKPKLYINEYVNFLKNELNTNDVSGDLISVSQLNDLGCNFNGANSYNGEEICSGSAYVDWIILDSNQFWTKTILDVSQCDIFAFGVGNFDYVDDDLYFLNGKGIRPVITIPKSLAKKYYVKTYDIGEEVTIEDEMFNVISDNGDTITMLAQYNLGTDYRQTSVSNIFGFSNKTGWEYTPGPKEIDIQLYDGNAKTYVNEYTSYLRGVTGDVTLSGNLITLSQLKDLDCVINDDYSGDRVEGCTNSKYYSWLITDQFWWTRSASSGSFYTEGNDVWVVMIREYEDSLYVSSSSGAAGPPAGIRPIITISKEALE